MFPQHSSVSINSLINSSIQGRNEPSSPLPSWFGNARTPMQYEDEKVDSFRSQPAIPVEGFVDKSIDSRYYSTSNITDTQCLIESWRHKNLDAPNQRNPDTPNQRNIDAGGRLSSDNSYYQRLDYGHCRQSPTTFDNTTDRLFPEESNSGLQRKEYLTNNPAISDDELFQLFEDGLDVMVQTNDGIQCFMDFDPRLRSFFLPIFKDHDLDAVIRIFGQGEESVAIKKLEEMVLLTKNKIQHLCTEIAETISIRSRKEAEQKSRRFVKPDRSLYNHEHPVDQREDDLNERSEFCQSSDDPYSDTLMPQYRKPALDDYQPTGLLTRLDLKNFPPPLVPPPPIGMFPHPLLPLGMPFLPLPHLSNKVPPCLATAAQANTLLPPPVIKPFLGIPTRPSQSILTASTTLLPEEKPRLVEPAVKKPQKIKYPPCLKYVSLLPISNTKIQNLNTSISKIKSMSPKAEPDPKKAKTTKIPSLFDSITRFSKCHPKGQSNFLSMMKRMKAKARFCRVEPAAKKAKTTELPSLIDSITPLSKSNANTQSSDNSGSMIKKLNTKKSKMKTRQIDPPQKEKIICLVEHLKNLEKNPPSKNIFLDKLFDKIGRSWLQINYRVTQQDDFMFGSLSIGGVFITRQKTKRKMLLRKTILERAYDVLQLIPVDEIIELGDPNADDETVLKEEKFDLIINIKKIKNLIATWNKDNDQPDITLADINKSVTDTSLLVHISKMLKHSKTDFHVIGKVMLGTFQIALGFASTIELATERAVASAIQKFKSFSPEEIAYEKGM